MSLVMAQESSQTGLAGSRRDYFFSLIISVAYILGLVSFCD